MNIILPFHNLIRWVVLIAGVLVVGRALWGWLGKKAWAKAERILGLVFTITIDMQLLLGLLLYFVYSTITRTALQDFGAAMSNDGLRFFAVEHAFLMLLAVIFAHVGSVATKKGSDPAAKYKRAVLWFGLALLVILAGMPWPPVRPLLRGF
jgi:hypothetical protein